MNNNVSTPEQDKRSQNRVKMTMLKELKDEISKPIQLPTFNFPPIQLPMVQQPAKPPQVQRDWIDGFLISTEHTLRSFPKVFAEDTVDELNEILKKARKQLRENPK